MHNSDSRIFRIQIYIVTEFRASLEINVYALHILFKTLSG